MSRLPTFFISHGGGPWPWLEGPFRRQFDALEGSLREIAASVGGKPRAILMVSGHWEESAFTAMAGERPGMVYDYGGFPEHTYRIRYEAPGLPALAHRVHEVLAAAGLPAALDAQRGFDHGAFAPLAIMYPHADVPVVQLSLKAGLSPREHFAAGRALAPLRDEGVLIVASGLSWHNLRMFGPSARAPSEAFDAWLSQALAASPQDRVQALERWEAAPAARLAHPYEDHFSPLMVALGAAEGEAAERVYHERGFMGGATVASYRFGALPALRKAA
jgi:aromatic ring-opening dioxygenase catalytic subunit (LigB family)